MTTNVLRLLCAALAVAKLGIATTAVAQTESDNRNAVEEVVVTAQRRSERLQDVPISVTQVDAADLIAGNKTSVLDYFAGIPGLTMFSDGYGAGLFAIRGITTGGATVPTVGIYFDDTPIGASTVVGSGNNPAVPDLDPNDLMRIEVLKGPQGTLYGASSMGGVVRYVTVPPDTTEFSGRVQVDSSNVLHGGNGFGVRGTVNIPLVSERLAVRMSASHRRDAGFLDNIADGTEDVNSLDVDNVRGAVLWQPAENLAIKLNALFYQRTGNGPGRMGYDFTADTALFGDLKQNRVPNVHQDRVRYQIYSATVDLDLGDATLTSVSSFATNPYHKVADNTSTFGPLLRGILGIPTLGTINPLDNETEKFTQEIRLASSTNPSPAANDIDWIAGLYYGNEKSNSSEFLMPVDATTGSALLGLPLIVHQSSNTKAYEVAGFGAITYHFSPRFNVQSGVRYSYNNQKARQVSEAGVLGGGSSILGRSDEGVPTFLITPQYKIGANTMVYARFATGYRVGGPNFILPGSDTATEFSSDETTAYEVGVKSSFFDRTLYVEANAFHIDWTNIQLQARDALALAFITNAGGAVSSGFEMFGQFRPTRALSFTANLSYSDAHLTDDAPTVVYAPRGSRLAYSPKVAGQVAVEYTHALTADWNASVGADATYVGSRVSEFTASAAVPRIRLSSYDVVGLRGELSNGRFTFGIFAKNLLDKHGFVSAAPQTLSRTAEYGVVVVPPRTIGISAAAKF